MLFIAYNNTAVFAKNSANKCEYDLTICPYRTTSIKGL